MVNIVILSLNRVDKTIQCLEGLRDNDQGTEFRVTLIDNGSNVATKIALYKFVKRYDWIRLSLLAENIGCGWGRHLAVIMNKCEYLMNLDNDTIPQKDCVRSLLETIERDPKIMGVCAKVVETGYKDLNGIQIIYNQPCYILHNEQVDVDLVHGGATMWKKEAFTHANFNCYCMEDWDFSMQLKKQGYRLMNCPYAVVYHYPSRPIYRFAGDDEYNKIRRDKKMLREARNAFYKKWKLRYTDATATVSEVVVKKRPTMVVDARDSSLVHIRRR